MSNTKIIILCAGLSDRWNSYLNTAKHFAVINGQTVIENTLKLLDGYSDTEILIVVNDKNADAFSKFNHGLIIINSSEAKYEYNKIKSSFHYWNKSGKTIILMGDVWFTPVAIKRIIECHKKKILFWGRQKQSFLTKCHHGELFAISFYSMHCELISNACSRLEHYIDEMKIKIAGGWGLYDIISKTEFLMTGKKVIKGYALFSNFKHIIDMTDDIDKPDDYHNLIRALNRNIFSSTILTCFTSIFYAFVLVFDFLFEFLYLKIIHIFKK